MELLRVPPVSANNTYLLEGDIFIHALIDGHTKETQVWCLVSTSSTSRLVWKTWEPLRDIRLISNVPYALLLQDNYEPSWILERSLARKRRKVRIVLIVIAGVNDFGRHLVEKQPLNLVDHLYLVTLMKLESLELGALRFELMVAGRYYSAIHYMPNPHC